MSEEAKRTLEWLRREKKWRIGNEPIDYIDFAITAIQRNESAIDYLYRLNDGLDTMHCKESGYCKPDIEELSSALIDLRNILEGKSK